MTVPQRPPAAYVHGVGGPVVVIPARVCAWLERHAQLNEVGVRERGADPEVDAAHAALAVIAAGALQDAHGKDWKEHVTDFPDSLKDIA